MTTATLSPKTTDKLAFIRKSAKVWQNFFDARGWLPNIELSPEQISVVQQEEDHLLINGAAGSGKSLTLIYKMLKAMEQEKEPKRILFCAFNSTLIQDANKRLYSSPRFQQLRERHDVKVMTFHNVATELLKDIGLREVTFTKTDLRQLDRNERLATNKCYKAVQDIVKSEAYEQLPQEQRFFKTLLDDISFIRDEMLWMKANGFLTEAAYLECERVGRGSNPRLTKEQRKTMFKAFVDYQKLQRDGEYWHLDMEDYALLLLKHTEEISTNAKFDYIFVDEVQDLQAMQLKALITLTKKSLVVAGDPNQRIYKRSPLSYREIGLFIEGRKKRHLKVNYRSTKQILEFANEIPMDKATVDHDDIQYINEGTRPFVRYSKTVMEEAAYICEEIHRIKKREPTATVAIIHRHDNQEDEVRKCVIKQQLNRNFAVVDTTAYHKFNEKATTKQVYYTDAYTVKGLEFDYVFVIHFDKSHYPHEQKIAQLKKRNTDTFSPSYQSDEEQIHDDERKVLYVAITRAKKAVYLLYNGATEKRISPFIRDFRASTYEAHGFKQHIYARKENE